MNFLQRLLILTALALGIAQPGVYAQTATTHPAGAPAASSTSGSALSGPATSSKDPWWKHAVLYEIYPRSFQDSNGDGVGDINGITSRLGYLQQLGVDAIWITPMYPSPQVDFGYDISDYDAIDPQYGTMADFDHMVAEAKAHHIRVIMDFVPNHTSDQHPWFKESRSSLTNPKRNWYIWRNGTAPGPGHPPNNWQSWFGHSAWQYDPATKQYYYHHFYVQQPDLNWRNPQVQKAMFDVLRFWMNKGVSGFRIDAVSRLFEDPNLHNDPILPGTNAYGDPNIQHKYTDNLPEVHDMLREMRNVVNKYPGNAVLISEADEPNIAQLTKMYGRNNDEVQLPMDFQVADINELSVPKFRKFIGQIESNAAHGQPYFFFSNHDQPRLWDRYSEGVSDPAMKARIARIMAAILLTSRATPQLYYGDEIGMVTTTPARKEDVKDPIGILGWPKEKGRDGERTPMQWNTDRNAGFTTSATPWLPVAPNYKLINVETESVTRDSMLHWYERLIALRRSNDALREGGMVMLDTANDNVLAYLRKGALGMPSVIVALNFTAQPQVLNYDLPPSTTSRKMITTLLTDDANLTRPPVSRPVTGSVILAPFATWIAEVE